VLGFLSTGDFVLLTVSSALVGGVAHPLYGLLVAHTNDYLEREQMASASGGLLMLNGIGATGTPIFVGYMMDVAGAETYMVAIFGLMGLITLYGLYRMTVRPSVAVADTLPMALAPVGTSMSQVGSEMMQEVVVDRIEAAEAAEVHAAEVDAAEARLTAAATPTETAPLR
jgi:MFS family permease